MSETVFVSPEKPPEGLDRELLTILSEECAEIIREAADVQIRISKILRFGLTEVQPGQLMTNLQRLGEEVGDLFEVVNRAINADLIHQDDINKGRSRKYKQLAKYLQNAP